MWDDTYPFTVLDMRKKHVSIVIQLIKGFCFTCWQPTKKVPHSGRGFVVGLGLFAVLIEVR